MAVHGSASRPPEDLDDSDEEEVLGERVATPAVPSPMEPGGLKREECRAQGSLFFEQVIENRIKLVSFIVTFEFLMGAFHEDVMMLLLLLLLTASLSQRINFLSCPGRGRAAHC